MGPKVYFFAFKTKLFMILFDLSMGHEEYKLLLSKV